MLTLKGVAEIDGKSEPAKASFQKSDQEDGFREVSFGEKKE